MAKIYSRKDVWYGTADDMIDRIEALELEAEGSAAIIMAERAEVLALRKRIAKADALAAWAKAISERKASPVTGGRLILERDIVGLETALDAYREG